MAPTVNDSTTASKNDTTGSINSSTASVNSSTSAINSSTASINRESAAINGGRPGRGGCCGAGGARQCAAAACHVRACAPISTPHPHVPMCVPHAARMRTACVPGCTARHPCMYRMRPNAYRTAPSMQQCQF
eukprot:256-Rhodomonas_salina.1